MFDLLWRSIAIGIGATILMDIWSIALAKGAIPNWGPPGRWLWHLFAKGTVFHDDIGKAALFLMTNDFVTGAILDVSGGETLVNIE